MNNRQFYVRLVLFVVVAFFVMWATVKWTSEKECYEHWKDAGIKSEHRAWAGCMVELKPGVWVPDKNYRVTW